MANLEAIKRDCRYSWKIPILNLDFHVERAGSRVIEGSTEPRGFTRGSIYVDPQLWIRVIINKGSIPEFKELLYIIASSKRGIRVLRKAFEFKRKNPYHIEARIGDSGCIDYKLISARYIGNVWLKEVKTKLHVSMYGKCNYSEQLESGIFLPDLLAIFRGFDNEEYESLKHFVHSCGRRKSASIIKHNMRKIEGVVIKFNRPSIEWYIKPGEDGWMVD